LRGHFAIGDGQLKNHIRCVALPPSVLRDLAVELQELEAVTKETNRELKTAHIEAAEGGKPAERLLDRALASIEHDEFASQR
jgi:hypothetical protein